MGRGLDVPLTATSGDTDERGLGDSKTILVQKSSRT